MSGCGRPGRVTPTRGEALLLDAPPANPWPSVLALADALVGRLEWWPRLPADVGSSLVGALAGGRRHIDGRPVRRPSRFADAGMTLLRTERRERDLVPVRRRPARVPQHRRPRARGRPVGGGPLRGRGHPGRSRHLLLSRRTRMAFLLPVDARPQHRRARRPRTSPPTVVRSCGCGRRMPARSRSSMTATSRRWTAEHNGYASLDPPALHRRSVLLDRASRSIDIIDEIEGGRHEVVPGLPLRSRGAGGAPGVRCAILSWSGASTPGAARLELPPGLRWSLHRGETEPILGWYSPGLGRRVPAFSLVGRGRSVPGAPLATRLEFLEAGESARIGRLPAARIMGCIRRRAR